MHRGGWGFALDTWLPIRRAALLCAIRHHLYADTWPPAGQNPGASVACGRRMGVNLRGELSGMVKFLLWCILLFFCWPLALLALVLYPLVWILMLPFRLVGIAVEGVFELLRAIITLPARVLSGPRHV